MRKQIVAGNWKMNKDYVDSEILVSKLLEQHHHSTTDVIIAPPFTNLLAAKNTLKGSPISVAAQNMHFAENGAYTGEVSASMLTSIGVKTVILGHSERRAYFNETDEMLAKKVDTALAHGMRIIFCFGEELADRKAKKENEVVASQIKNALGGKAEILLTHCVVDPDSMNPRKPVGRPLSEQEAVRLSKILAVGKVDEKGQRVLVPSPLIKNIFPEITSHHTPLYL